MRLGAEELAGACDGEEGAEVVERLVDFVADVIALAWREAAVAKRVGEVGLEDVLEEVLVDLVAELWSELVEDADVRGRVLD